MFRPSSSLRRASHESIDSTPRSTRSSQSRESRRWRRRAKSKPNTRQIEAEQKSGKWRGPLHGIPVALKDNIDTAGIRTTAASGVFKDRVPAEDAEVVVRLK